MSGSVAPLVTPGRKLRESVPLLSTPTARDQYTPISGLNIDPQVPAMSRDPDDLSGLINELVQIGPADSIADIELRAQVIIAQGIMSAKATRNEAAQTLADCQPTDQAPWQHLLDAIDEHLKLLGDALLQMSKKTRRESHH